MNLVKQDLGLIKGPKGDTGEQGQQGIQGPKGDTGITPTLQVGSVETLPFGSEATVEMTGQGSDYVLDFGIPRGKDGDNLGDMLASVYDPQSKAEDIFAYADEKMAKTGGTFTGVVTGTSPANDSRALRNILLGDGKPDALEGQNGDIYLNCERGRSAGGVRMDSLLPGTMIKLPECGTPTKFVVLGINHYSPDSGVTLLRLDALCPQMWNLCDSKMLALNRKCYYKGSTADLFCEVSYPALFEPAVRDMLRAVPIKVARNETDNTMQTINRRGFLLAEREVAQAVYSTEGEGVQFAYFNTIFDTWRQAKLDGGETPVSWWLRSPAALHSGLACYISTSGTQGCGDAYESHGMRPALNFDGGTLVTSETDTDRCRSLMLTDTAPTVYVKEEGAWMFL